MKRIVGTILATTVVAGAVAFSRIQSPSTDVAIQTGAKNPWNHLRFNNDPAEFRFAVVSDRTGGHRERVFSVAVEQLNLLQPEFVVSVGDLIEGYAEEAGPIQTDWTQFQGFVNRLRMPFFYVPGNHDISNDFQEKWWRETFGRSYYHFVYRNVLFLMLNSSDPPKSQKISSAQLAYTREALAANPDVRWTFIFLHHPLWTAAENESNGWAEVEKALGDRPCSVFCGHIHRYQRYVRNGRVYYQLATTGGGSKVRGPRYGEFDHITWVTVKKEGPVLAHLLLDGILTENLQKPQTKEAGVSTAKRLPTYPVRGRFTFEGKPIADAEVVLHAKDAKAIRGRPDGLTDADGSFVITTYKPSDGAPAFEYTVTVMWRPRKADDKRGENLLPARYAKPETSGLRIEVHPGPNQFDIDLRK